MSLPLVSRYALISSSVKGHSFDANDAICKGKEQDPQKVANDERRRGRGEVCDECALDDGF